MRVKTTPRLLSPLQNISLLIMFLLFAGIGTSFSQSCSAQLNVKKNRSFKSATELNGAAFVMELKNTSGQATTFSIKTKDISSSCANKRLATKKPNVSLLTSIKQKSSKAFASGDVLKVGAGETVAFQIKVDVPAGTAYDHWSCIEVSAIAANCRTVASTETLSVYVSNPAEN